MEIGTLTQTGITNRRTVDQSKLSEECWGVQFFGLDNCKSCELKGKRDCGGKNIRKTGKNNKGFSVPL